MSGDIDVDTVYSKGTSNLKRIIIIIYQSCIRSFEQL
jgi:hypothetical protein